MAERYPVYTSQVGISSLPGIDYVQLKDAAKDYSNVADAMSKMSTYFFKQAGEFAEAEGEDWGAANPVTKDQLEASRKSGIVPEVLKDDWSIFGQAAKDAAIVAGSNNMEAGAKRQFVEIITTGLRNGTPSGEIQKQLDAVTLGYTNALMDASPAAAMKLKATLSVSASSAWQTYINDELTQSAKRDKAALVALVDYFLGTELVNLIETGTTVEGGIDAVFEATKQRVIKTTYGIDIRGASDAYTLKIIKLFDDAYLEVRKNSIVGYITEDPDFESARNAEFVNGKFKDNRIQELFDSLKQDERNDLRKLILDVEKQNHDLLKAAELRESEMIDRKVKTLAGDYYKALLFEQDMDKAEGILKEIEIVDVNDTLYPTLAKVHYDTKKS